MRQMRIALAFLLAGTVWGQEYRGTFTGSITDPQGSVIPGAKVITTERRTGVKSNATSGQTGAYAFRFLPPGEYEISAEARGFKRFVRTGLTLSGGESPIIDIRLEIGA